MTERNITTYF